MSTVLQFFLHTEPGHFVLLGIFLLAVSSMEAPTKDSSAFYRYSFRFLNGAALQLKRMFPKVENSPNFGDAVNQLPAVAVPLPPVAAVIAVAPKP